MGRQKPVCFFVLSVRRKNIYDIMLKIAIQMNRRRLWDQNVYFRIIPLH